MFSTFHINILVHLGSWVNWKIINLISKWFIAQIILLLQSNRVLM